MLEVDGLVVWLSQSNGCHCILERSCTKLISNATIEFIQSLGIVGFATTIAEVDESLFQVECPNKHLTGFKQITQLVLVGLDIFGGFTNLGIVPMLFQI